MSGLALVRNPASHPPAAEQDQWILQGACLSPGVLACRRSKPRTNSKEPAGERPGDGYGPNSWSENPGTSPSSRMDARRICAPFGFAPGGRWSYRAGRAERHAADDADCCGYAGRRDCGSG